MRILILNGALLSLIATQAVAQNGNHSDPGQIHGNISIFTQQYNEDTLINAVVPPAETAMNSFANFMYTRGNFRAGVRYEGYLNRIEGFPQEYNGSGIGFRYAGYTNDNLDITVGNFYEQFGNGLILRSYQEPTLGIDNALDGVRVSISPHKGVYLKGLYGKVRTAFDSRIINSDGFVRGVDGEVSLNEVNEKWEDSKHRLSLGGSFVTKFQRDNDPDLILPENVGSWAARANYTVGGFGINGEFAYKINDPSLDNNYIYKPGRALMFSTQYSTKGFGIVLDYKYNDNMSYRIDRDAKLANALIGFLPSLTRPHTYNLAATLYPPAVQPNGEVAYQANVSYKFKRGSAIGGKYGMTVAVNYAVAFSLDSTLNHGESNPLYGYESTFLAPGEELYFQDFNIEIKRKFSKKFKATLMYLNFVYNNDIMQGARDNEGNEVHGEIRSHIGVLDMSYKINRKHNLRAEFQAMIVGKDDNGMVQHQGHWATGVLEYTYSPHWFVSVQDQYNFGNPDDVYKIHYVISSVGYVNGANRIVLNYGKQRAGLFCVGGVCRAVPASNGFTLTFSTSF